jgi:hypothetical protein
MQLHQRSRNLAVRHALHGRRAAERPECNIRREHCVALVPFLRLVNMLRKELLHADILERELRW